ncbi:MAG: DNA repair protein RecO [Chloroflexi bacterium]|nr:DNA repair protein RecO [Chloroflexota bacterium]
MTAQAYHDGLQRPPPGGRPRAYKTDGLVLRAYQMRDADRLATVLTPSLGKLKLTVRGARRLTSKLGGHLDVLNRTHLAIAIGHTFDVVTGAESAESFAGVKADLSRLAEALYLMELADLLLPEAAPHPDAYRLLLGALRALESGRSPAAVARHTELGLLGDAGYMPELRSCVMCRRAIEPEHHRFSPAMGGVVCDACTAPSAALLPLSVDTLKVLRHFAERGVAEAPQVALSGMVSDELESALGASVRYVLEREPHTAGFVERVAHLRRRGA